MAKALSIDVLYDPDLYQKGELLLAENALKNIKTIDAHLYEIEIFDDELYAVELFKPFSKAQKATCSCSTSRQKKLCKHIVAALIAFQRNKENELHEQKTQTTEPKVAHLSINNLISVLTLEELKSFVKSYASTDKKFSIALKVNFAKKIDTVDNEQKYKAILDTIVKPITNTAYQVKSSDIRSLLSIIRDLFDQMHDALGLQLMREAYLIGKNVINKTNYCLHNFSYHQEDLIEWNKKFHEFYYEFIPLIEAQELKLTLTNFLKEMCATSYYHLYDLTNNGFEILYRFKLILPEELLEIIQAKISKLKFENQEYFLLYASYLRILFHEDLAKTKSSKVNLFDLSLPAVDEALKNVLIIEKVVDELMLIDAYDCSIYLLLKAIEREPSNGNLYIKLIETLAASNKKPLLIKHLADFFLSSNDIRCLEVGKRLLDAESFDTVCQKLNKVMDKKKISPHIKGQYYTLVEQWDDLIAVLDATPSFKLVQQFDSIANEHRPNELATIYETLVEDYLNNHLGDASNKFIEDFFKHLNKIKANRSMTKIGLLIELKFNHRSRLNLAIQPKH